MNTKSLSLDLIRVTENAAIAAAHFVGRGDKHGADEAATKAMLNRLNTIDFSGEVVIGEGKKDDAPGLFKGNLVGSPCLRADKKTLTPQFDIAVDPIEGTTPTAKGGYEAMSVIAVGNKGCLFSSEDFYMKKLAVGPHIAKNILNRHQECLITVKDDLRMIVGTISSVCDIQPEKLTICILDRPRHDESIAELRELGCRIKLISDCDVSGAIATCVHDSGIDIYYGIGGAPEGVISAAALKCMRGYFQGMIVEKEGKPIDDKIYNMEDLAKDDVIFCATGITDGSLLRGVRFIDGKPHTNSVLMRSESGTVRWISAIHGN
jgi:fructose-1,6-bisphosphatase class II